MSQTSERIAGFLKIVSMFMVIGSLVYLYGYVTDIAGSITIDSKGTFQMNKANVFYFGLGFFVVSNVIMYLIIYIYKGTKGVDANSFLFRSEKQKKSIGVWLDFMLAGLNFFIVTVITYLALSMINEVSGKSALMYIPIAGLIIFSFITAGLLRAVFRK